MADMTPFEVGVTKDLEYMRKTLDLMNLQWTRGVDDVKKSVEDLSIRLTKSTDEINKKIEEKYATREELKHAVDSMKPTKNVVNGLIMFILTLFLSAIASILFKKAV